MKMPHCSRRIRLAKRIITSPLSIHIELLFSRFVLAVRKDAVDNRAPVFLRSSKHPHEPRDVSDIKIWQAARATSAAPSYFSSIRVGDRELVDGGLGANNPFGS